jgi:hypothetical protein
VARSRNHFCHRYPTIISFCVVVCLNIAVKTVQFCNRKTIGYLCEFLELQINSYFCKQCKGTYDFTLSSWHLNELNEIWSFSTDFRTSAQHQISRQSVRWEPRWYCICGRRQRRTGWTHVTELVATSDIYAWTSTNLSHCLLLYESKTGWQLSQKLAVGRCPEGVSVCFISPNLKLPNSNKLPGYIKEIDSYKTFQKELK